MDPRQGWSRGLLCCRQGSGRNQRDCPQATERIRNQRRDELDAAAYLATSLKQVRRVPGRLSGESLDKIPFELADPRAAHSWYTAPQDGQAEDHRQASCVGEALDVSTLSSADLVKTLIPKHIDEMHYTEDVHAIITALKDAGVKDTARLPEAFATNETLPAAVHLQLHTLSDQNDALHDQVTVQGSVPDDLDDFHQLKAPLKIQLD